MSFKDFMRVRTAGLTAASETAPFSSRTVPVVSACEEQDGASVAPRVAPPHLALDCTSLTIVGLFTSYKKQIRFHHSIIQLIMSVHECLIPVLLCRMSLQQYTVPVCRMWRHLVVCLHIATNGPLLLPGCSEQSRSLRGHPVTLCRPQRTPRQIISVILVCNVRVRDYR